MYHQLSTRNTLTKVADGRRDAVLDAARDTVMAVGVRRTTVSDVARRAGVSRTTVYRRYPDAATLLRAVMAREFSALISEAESDVGEEIVTRDGLVAAIVRTAELLSANPVMVRLLDVDPELLLPYLTERIGRFQGYGRGVLAARIAAAHEYGQVRDGDAATMAATIELALRGFVIAGRTLSRSERAAMLDEIRLMIEAYLSPTA
jgi:AcrR family transcriptional regulator